MKGLHQKAASDGSMSLKSTKFEILLSQLKIVSNGNSTNISFFKTLVKIKGVYGTEYFLSISKSLKFYKTRQKYIIQKYYM